MRPIVRSARSAPAALGLGLALAPLARVQAQDTSHVARDTARLAPIVVTANRAAQPAASLPSATTTLDAQPLLRGRPALGLDELLTLVPGLVVNDRFNPAQDETLSIRGFGARAAFGIRGVTVLLDGIPQTLPDGQSQLSNVDLSYVTHVEVLRGAAATLYGNGAGGVISLSTDQSVPRRVSAHGTAGAGAFGLRELRGALAAPVGAGALRIEATRITSDGYRAHSRADIWKTAAHFVTPLGRGTRLIATLDATDQPTLQDPGALTSAELDTNPRMASPRNLAVDAGKDVRQAEAGVTLEHRGANGASFDATVFGLRRDLHNPITVTVIDLGRWVGGTRLSGTLPVTVGGARHTITVGLDAQEQRDARQNHDDTGTLTLDQLERVTSVGPFARAVIHLLGRLTVSAGGRYDRLTFRADDHLLTNGDQSGSRVLAAPSGAFGIAAVLTPAVTAFADVGTSFETPTTTELANRPDGSGGFNPSLSPQHARQLESGVRVRTPRVRFELVGYTTRVSDELVPFQVPGQPGRTFYRNAGSATHRGIEASARVRPVSWMSVDATYTYTHLRFDTFRTATDTLDGNTIPGVPAHAGYLALRLTRGTLWLTADETWRTRTWANDVNRASAGGWGITGLYMGLDARTDGVVISPSLGITNLFDARYVANVVVNAAAGRYFEPGASRGAFVGLTLRW